MPGFDGTGPRGQGEMTGGGRGYCAMPVGETGSQFGRGSLYGRGGGRGGRRNCYYATGLSGWVRAQKRMQAFGGFDRSLSKGDELTALKSQAEYPKKELDAVQSRVQDMESK